MPRNAHSRHGSFPTTALTYHGLLTCEKTLVHYVKVSATNAKSNAERRVVGIGVAITLYFPAQTVAITATDPQLHRSSHHVLLVIVFWFQLESHHPDPERALPANNF